MPSSISQSDLNDLTILLSSGDRGGFYYKYYQLTGEYQALIQAQITTYSGAWGGLAMTGNYFAKMADPNSYDITLDEFSFNIAN